LSGHFSGIRFSILFGTLWVVSLAASGAEERKQDGAASDAPTGKELAASQGKADFIEVQAAAVVAAKVTDDGRAQVRLVGTKTDVAKKYRVIIPPLPIPPFTTWRQWFKDHEEAVHCALEWCNDKGEWFHGELRSTHFDVNSESFRVGWGEFPGTAYDAYGIYIMPGRIDRTKDSKGRDVVISCDEEIKCDFRDLEVEIRQYAAKYARQGDPGTGGIGKKNVGLGGPAYKPSQNSNTMVKYILRNCGVNMPAPDLAIGWESEPHFPYSADADAPAMDNRP
jgi:hypothetical protein